MYPRPPTPRVAAVALILALILSQPPLVSGQSSESSTASVVASAALGAYSGTVLGLVGAAGPCDWFLAGPACLRATAAMGGTLGLAAGVVLARNDSGALGRHFASAGYGALAGGLVGLGLSGVVRQYRWPDPLAFAAVGAAIGASPEGAGLGFAAGAAVGVLSWMVVPRLAVGDAITVAVMGLAAGGIVGWVWEANNSRSGRSSRPVVSISVPLRLRLP